MEKNIEEWKSLDFIGFQNYEVSNLGRVKSLNYNHTDKENVLKADKNNDGYYRVEFRKNNKRKKYSVHRLVALAFIPNPDTLPVINHKDEDKSNNRVENLEWCTRTYNNNYGTRNERTSEKLIGNTNRRGNTFEFVQYCKENQIKGKENIRKLAEEKGLNWGSVRAYTNPSSNLFNKEFRELYFYE